MKKLLLTAIAATALATSADATLKKGDVAPDFTLSDINGVSQHLYAYLDSGYTVIIDESAAWCAPCWAVHQSGVFNTLISQYGPNGTVQAKKIRVIFIEGETTNTTAQLHGPALNTGSYATTTQGDWITGENYPFIDNPPTATRNDYLDGGFPTFTVIGQDRIVYEQTAGYTNAMLATSYWTNFLTNNVVPTYGPSATTDAKVVAQEMSDVYLCSANPKIRFQNYGTQPITSATLKVLSGSTTVATQTWTGNLAKYAVADVQMPGFTQAGPYMFEVTVTNDAVSTNNSTSVASLNMITSAQSTAIPVSQDFQSVTTMPSKYILDGDAKEQFILSSSLVSQGNPITVVGSNGQTTNCVGVMYQNNPTNFSAEMNLGNYNTASASAPAFKFDLAYQQKAANCNDKLEILVSSDCGVTWTSVYNKTGSQLATKSTYLTSGFFLPAAASDWRTEVSQTLPKNNNLFVKLVATTSSSGSASYGWIDNFSFVTSSSVNDIIGGSSVNLYPNPTRDAATLEFTSIKPSNVTIQVVDMTGRIVANVANENFAAGAHNVSINTADLPSGIYNVKIHTEEGNRAERLTVVK